MKYEKPEMDILQLEELVVCTLGASFGNEDYGNGELGIDTPADWS